MSKTDDIRAALRQRPMRDRELRDLLGGSVSNNIGRLRKWKEVRVSGWHPTGRMWVAIFALGSKPDTPKPAPKSAAQRLREYRARKRPPKLKPKSNATCCHEYRKRQRLPSSRQENSYG